MGSTVESTVMTGARALFLKDGKPVAYAGGVDGSEEITYEPVDVLNNIFVQEHAPTGYRCTMNCQLFRQPSSSPKGQGIYPKTNNWQNDILKMKGYTVLLQDAVDDGAILVQVEGVRPTTCNFSVAARGLFQNNCSFVGIRMMDVEVG